MPPSQSPFHFQLRLFNHVSFLFLVILVLLILYFLLFLVPFPAFPCVCIYLHPPTHTHTEIPNHTQPLTGNLPSFGRIPLPHLVSPFPKPDIDSIKRDGNSTAYGVGLLFLFSDYTPIIFFLEYFAFNIGHPIIKSMTKSESLKDTVKSIL